MTPTMDDAYDEVCEELHQCKEQLRAMKDRYCHNIHNDSCPLNDPETSFNPVVAGLPCTCPVVPKPTVVYDDTWRDLINGIMKLNGIVIPEYSKISVVGDCERDSLIRLVVEIPIALGVKP